MSRSPSSRFFQGASYAWPAEGGGEGREQTIELLEPRFSRRAPLGFVHRVVSTDRLDLLAARYFGDPLQAWRIVDANPCNSPDELLVPGRLLRIPRRE